MDTNKASNLFCYVAPHFNCLDQGNTMMPFMMMLVSCDVGASGNCVT